MSAKDIAAFFVSGTLALSAITTRLAQSPEGQQGFFLGMTVGAAVFYIGWNAGKSGRAIGSYVLVGFALSILLTFWGTL